MEGVVCFYGPARSGKTRISSVLRGINDKHDTKYDYVPSYGCGCFDLRVGNKYYEVRDISSAVNGDSLSYIASNAIVFFFGDGYFPMIRNVHHYVGRVRTEEDVARVVNQIMLALITID